MGTQQEAEMKSAVLLGAGGILVCVFLVVMGTSQREAAADEGRGKSTLKKKVDDLQKQNRPGQATCPFMYYFPGPAYDDEDDCHNNGPTDCYDEWQPSGPGQCSNHGCVVSGGVECDTAATADYLGQCYEYNNQWFAECRCHCWEFKK
jgi:hypothetical protein